MSNLVSVIMGIYNCQDTLSESLDCIVNQTYDNWEVIMCDDGSQDNTVEIAQQYVDKYPKKFFLLKNETNMGLNFTLNKCLKNSHGDYIARMDGDDLCSPERFELQVKMHEENPDIAIISTDMSFFDESGIWGRTYSKKAPTKKDFLNTTPFCHAAAMVKREAYFAVDGYSVDKKLLRVEDYHLWTKMYAKGYKGLNIQETLYQMRDDKNAQRRRKFKYRLNAAYARGYAVKHLHLPVYSYIYCLIPILKGLVPGFMYKIIHRKK